MTLRTQYRHLPLYQPLVPLNHLPIQTHTRVRVTYGLIYKLEYPTRMVINYALSLCGANIDARTLVAIFVLLQRICVLLLALMMWLVSLVDAALALAGEQRERRRSDSGSIVFRIGRHNSLLGPSQYRRKGCAIPVS